MLGSGNSLNFDDILSKVVVETDHKGHPIKRRFTASSISLPIINFSATERRAKEFINELVRTKTAKNIQEDLKKLISQVAEIYALTHDGFRASKKCRNLPKITVEKLYLFSIGATICLEFLPKIFNVKQVNPILLGVISPSRQSCGKNLIRVVWELDGYQVQDLGENVGIKTWISYLEREKFSALAISCMREGCRSNVLKLLRSIRDKDIDIPVILGGIAVDRYWAYDVGKELNCNVYYGRDLIDAPRVLEKALKNESEDAPKIVEPCMTYLPDNILKKCQQKKLCLYDLPINHVIVDATATKGCAFCEGERKKYCPLALGYEKQESLDASHKFVNSFSIAKLIITPNSEISNRIDMKRLWLLVHEIAQYYQNMYIRTYPFRFPTRCPFCEISECTLIYGKRCRFPDKYLPMHESLNIDMHRTLEKTFGKDIPTGLKALILVK